MKSFILALLNRFGKPILYVVLFICAFIVTLSVLGYITPESKVEQAADDVIKTETGFDLEKVEKDLFKK